MQFNADAFDHAWDILKHALPLDLLEAKLESAKRDLGRVNILLAGGTGVGKTTLINAVFGAKVGKTGTGQPVTQHVEWYKIPYLPVSLCDTRGLEMKAYTETLAAVEKELERAAASDRVEDMVHIAWLCISEGSSRVQDGERELARLCSRYGIPVIVVVTQAFGRPDVLNSIRQLIPEARAVVPVMAESMTVPPFSAHGLLELVAATERLLPEVAEKAFLAAQQIDMSKKRSRGLAIAASSAAAASAASLVPVPGVGTPLVLSINVGMVVGIAAAFGVAMDRAALIALGASIAGGLAVSTGGRMLLGEALKFIPGVGSIIGGALEASVAAATTYGLGAGFTEFLLWFYGTNARLPAGAELRDGFQHFWDQRKNKQVAPPTGS